MCMMLYIGSDNELPVIKPNKNPDSLILFGEILKEYEGIRRHLSKKYQYIVYALLSCGFACGFRFDELLPGENEYGNKARRALKELFENINRFVDGDNCELVACWIGDENRDLKYERTIKISEFDWKSEFSLLKGQHITVYK